MADGVLARLLLARRERLHAALRGLLAGGAVLLAEVALLSQSRGSLYATPVMLLARVRAAAGPDAHVRVAGAGRRRRSRRAAPAVLRVGDHSPTAVVTTANLHHAVAVSLALAAVAGRRGGRRRGARRTRAARARRPPGACGSPRAWRCARRSSPPSRAGSWRRANPVARIRHGWDTFKGGYGADSKTGSRLVSGLGSNRYDFYRVSLDEFLDHPVVGIGADNFQQEYLAHRRASETPHYPHSVELRTLADLGIVGTLIALLGLGGALLACARAVRDRDALSAAVAAAALGVFAYWVVHGSFDWFWEFAGLGAPAFAMLGLACSLVAAQRSLRRRCSRAAARGAPGATTLARRLRARLRAAALPRLRAPRVLVAGAAAALALAAALSLVATWLSASELQSAAKVWTTAPQTAYSRLHDAARLNPLSDAPYTLAGSIALRYSDLPRAEREFRQALARTPSDSYATLELGAIASARGRRGEALERLARAVALDPRDPLARRALAVVRSGRTVSVPALNEAILTEGRLVS